MMSVLPAHPARGRFTGFTLIEMILVAGLLAVLLSIALPQYRNYIQRSQRVEAIRLLTAAAACEERQRAGTGAYDTTRCGNNSDSEHYRLIIEPEAIVSSDIFTLIAVPIEAAGNEMCGSLSLNQAGTRGITGPAENLWKCWSGR